MGINSLFSISFITQFLLIVLTLISYYYITKKVILKLSPSIAKIIPYHQYSVAEIVGTIELTVTAITHVIFCVMLANLLHINLISVFASTKLSDCFYAIFIGIGCVGISILLCSVMIKLIASRTSNQKLKSANEWSAIAGAGWIRHHKHCITVFPLLIGLMIISLQIGSEETVFRSILIPYFASYGIYTAFAIATGLFILMQIFHMPNLLSAMFPMIGACVMGIVHGLLYLSTQSILPLIISHLTFFVFTLIKMESRT